jgi:transcriptional antiterminator RfaH
MMTYTTNEKQSWFLIQTNPRQEERTNDNLRAWNVETFYPQIRSYRCNEFSGARQYTVKPLFSRYLFARFNIESMYHKVRYTRGVQGLVSFGSSPVEVDQEIIELIHSRIGEDGFVKIGSELHPGDKVLIKSGIWKDFTGVLEREMKDSDRVIVLLSTINYQARLQIERTIVEKLGEVSYSA